MNLAKYDSIVFTLDSFQRVLEWGDANRALFKGSWAIPEGVIEITGQLQWLNNMRIYFKVQEDFVTLKFFNTDSAVGEYLIQHFEVRANSKYTLIELGSYYQKSLYSRILDSQQCSEHLSLIQDRITAFLIYVNSFMIYFENSEFVSVKEVKEARDVSLTQGNRAKGRKKGRSVVYLKKRYTLNAPDGIQLIKPTDPTRTYSGGWVVRGHFRFNPKTGLKDIWVRSYPKGDLKDYKPKTYKV